MLLYGGSVPSLKEVSVDTTGIRLGARLTITELGHSLRQLEAQLDGKTSGKIPEFSRHLLT